MAEPVDAAGLIDPHAVRFSQDSILSTFRDGRSLHELVRALREGQIGAAEIPPIRIFRRGPHLFTLDNRRLWAFQQASRAIPYRWATPQEIRDEAWKLTTKTEGQSVRLKQPRRSR